MFKPHECGDSRLACIDCQAQVCPKCFVECPVGNRCKQCANKFESHVLTVTVGALVKMFITAAAIGAAFGVLQGFVPGGGFWMWFIVYALGVGAGNIIHKVVGFRVGTKVMATATVGVLMGWVGVMHYGPSFDPVYGKMTQAPVQQEMAKKWRYATLAAFKHPDPEEYQTDPAMIIAKAQEQLPELVAAFNRHDECFVLVRTADGDKKGTFHWLRVVEVGNDHFKAVQALSDSEAQTVANDDVLDWQYISPKVGVQSGGFQSMHEDARSAEVAAAGAYRGARMTWGLVDAIIFLAGIITVLSGQVPVLRLPFFR